jgi:hypothetical protein
MKQFLIIILVIFLIQLPNWYFILGRETGRIYDFGNENWIVVSDAMSTVFSFPIYFFISDRVDNLVLAFMIYLLDLGLMSVVIHFVLNGVKKLDYKYKRI